MTELTKDLNRLKLFYVTKGSTRDKDLLKEESYNKYANKICWLFVAPISIQIYQIGLLIRNAGA